MRALLFSFATLLVACTCEPATPTAVTLRLKNTGSDPIYVDDTDGKLGLQIQLDDMTVLAESRCDCLACEAVCSAACTCPDPSMDMVLRVDPNTSVERVFSGVGYVDFVEVCFGAHTPCQNAQNIPVNQTLDLHLCFVNERPAGVDDSGDAGAVLGDLPPVGQTCVDKSFQISDGVVEIGPERGAACNTTADCKGTDELCFSGSCTASCPANGFPDLGATWSLRIPSIEDEGFFTMSGTAPKVIYSGTGTLTSVQYQGQTMELSLSRPGTGTDVLTGTVYVALPPGQAAPLLQGTTVTVRVLDDSQESPENRAITIRAMDNTLLFAADVAQPGPLLTADDLAPFAVTSDADIIGCRVDGCGKLLYAQTRFAAGTDAVDLDPGASAEKSMNGALYELLNISDGHYATTTCDVDDLRPWALWKK